MNYLAHCFLSPATPASLVGNLLGDFCKGVDERRLSVEVKAGLINHRAVDKFTDNHPLVRQAKVCFSPHRRRFAGIALDVLFDYYLISHWHLFSAIPFDVFRKNTYQLIVQGVPLMPEPMQQVMTRVVSQDWFANYQSLQGVGHTLDQIADRLRFSNQFSGCIEDIRKHNNALEAVFLSFFVQLQEQLNSQC